MPEIQHRIKDRLGAMGKSMADLSRDSGITYPTLNNYLNGLSPMPEEAHNIIEAQFQTWERANG